MRRALDLAASGQGFVEPNPMVGCVIARGAEIIGEGWHRRFGGDHAEVEALRLAGSRAAGATLYVTLEPCCHTGKTPPCTEAILAAGIRRVVAAMADPFPQVAGGGAAALQAAGVAVELGLLADQARQLNAPYLKLLEHGVPWIIAKWAMTLDGKIATRTGQSRWISGSKSRQLVHALRGRMDAVVVGRGTAAADDPLLTARPAGPRTPMRVVLDTRASLPSESQLVRTAGQAPLLVAVGSEAEAADCRRLQEAGCEVLVCPGGDPCGPARRLVAGTRPPAADQRARGRRRPGLGQPVGRPADRRGARLHCPEAPRRRRGPDSDRRPGRGRAGGRAGTRRRGRPVGRRRRVCAGEEEGLGIGDWGLEKPPDCVRGASKE